MTLTHRDGHTTEVLAEILVTAVVRGMLRIRGNHLVHVRNCEWGKNVQRLSIYNSQTENVNKIVHRFSTSLRMEECAKMYLNFNVNSKHLN